MDGTTTEGEEDVLSSPTVVVLSDDEVEGEEVPTTVRTEETDESVGRPVDLGLPTLRRSVTLRHLDPDYQFLTLDLNLTSRELDLLTRVRTHGVSSVSVSVRTYVWVYVPCFKR